MTMIGRTSLLGTIRTLWTRAPWWRFFLLSASLLTMLFIFFPPQQQNQTNPLPQTSATQGTYTSQFTGHDQQTPSTVPAPGNPVNEPVAKSVQNTTQSPKTAELSLAGQNKANIKQQNIGLNEAMTGNIYTKSVYVSGFTVPLPQGDWVMLANSTMKYGINSGMVYFLGRIEHKQLVGGVIIYTLKAEPPEIVDPNWQIVKTSGCNRTDALFLEEEKSVDANLPSCWYMFNLFTPAWKKWADRSVRMEQISRAAAGDLAAKGVTYPQDFITVAFVQTAKRGLLITQYLFTTKTEGITSHEALSFEDSDWSQRNINRFPEKVAFVKKIKAWGLTFLPLINKSFTTLINEKYADERQNTTVNSTQIGNANKKAVNSSAPISSPRFNNLLVKPGDTIDQVRSVYHTSAEPEPTDRPDKPGGKVLRLQSEGVWFFFDQTGKIYTIRLEAPFRGSIKGVKIGESLEMVLKSLGEPDKKLPNISPFIYFYMPTGLQLQFDRDTGAVRTIFLSK
ncbi:MAG: hypothetical protein ABSD50_09710 [Smithella sp.]